MKVNYEVIQNMKESDKDKVLFTMAMLLGILNKKESFYSLIESIRDMGSIDGIDKIKDIWS
jgi:hypothetical protein